jgi:signal transduction histidine kinase
MRGWLWQLRQSTVSPEILRRGLDVVARNAELQAGMVEDLLDTSRAMAGDLTLDPAPVDFAAICRTVVEAAQPAAAAAGLSLTLSADGAATVNGDATRLAQIVSNIVSNSVKFGFPGGRIDVAIRRLDDGIRLEVHDDGCGIEPEFLPHVFDPFRQAETGTTRRHGGLGLGLALVRQFTQMHGGTVRVISEGKGRGTTVVVDLPATSEPTHRSDARPSAVADSRPAIAH